MAFWKIFNMGAGPKQLRAKRADGALARGVHGGPGDPVLKKIL